MSVREDFEAWYSLQAHQLSNKQVCLVIWKAAYRAGELAMRERAAKGDWTLPDEVRALDVE